MKAKLRLPHFVGADPQQPEPEMDRAGQQEKPEMALPLKPRTTGEQREIATRTGVRSREEAVRNGSFSLIVKNGENMGR